MVGKIIIDTNSGENNIFFKIDNLKGKVVKDIILGIGGIVKEFRNSGIDIDKYNFEMFKVELIPTYEIDSNQDEICQIEFSPTISKNNILIVFGVLLQYIETIKPKK